MTEWWQDLFDEKFVRLFAEARTPAHTLQEVEGLKALLAEHGVPPGSQVLDLACGQGRITIPLAQAGYVMTGLDLSPYLLGRAQTAARQAGADITWYRADMRKIPQIWDGRFDAVVNTWTAFGYFEEPAQNLKVLQGVARVLKPDGVFILDVNHRDHLMANYRSTDWFEVDGLLVCTSREFDPISGMNTEYWLWVDESGERQSLSFKAHVYTATELSHMLREAGLQPVAYHGQLASPPESYPFDPLSRRLVIVTRHQPGAGSA